MEKPVLSICIPTYNRAEYLQASLECIVRDETFLNSNDIQIIISDNCSEDNTQSVCEKFVSKYPEKIKYVRQAENIGDKNYLKALSLAEGKYSKLSSDTIFYNYNYLSKIVNLLKNSDVNVIFFRNNKISGSDIEVQYFKNADDLFGELTYKIACIDGLCVKTEEYKKLNSPERFSQTGFAQVDIIARLTENTGANVVSGKTMEIINIQKNSDYNIPKLFGINLIDTLIELVKENLISKKTFEIFIKKNLTENINIAYNCSCNKDGYFKYLMKYYKFKPYFYGSYLKNLFKILASNIYAVEKRDKYKVIRLFKKIKISTKQNKKIFKNNSLSICDLENADKVVAGNYSYGEIWAFFHSKYPYKLYIGNYCSIAPDVKFIVGSDHPYKGLTTFPVKVKILGDDYEASSKGNIVVEDDVWIGANSIILSGVKISQGAIIAAGSVVTKDIPPYAIAGGNPAKIIKYRFEPEVIEKLLKVDFSKLTKEKVQKLGTKLYAEITKDNVDEIVEMVSGGRDEGK